MSNRSVGCDYITNWGGSLGGIPNNFYQLFTILVNIDGHCFPRLYALLPNKTEECYSHMYLKIHQLIQQSPGTVVSDFERASINALTTVFPESQHRLTNHKLQFDLG